VVRHYPPPNRVLLRRWRRRHRVLLPFLSTIVLQYDVEENTRKDYPLDRYAAEHWTTHAQFGEVSSHLQKGMKYLFDADKPYFKVWLTLYDTDTEPGIGATF
jgi:hypothetical protein